ncbi:hypothetical protein EYF80_039548 [Liparis tanakae]|uniref:Uncharacterized protein n=1 Tax=Liparis tanakae TaxID=230148 RepID=A0A4Z2GBH9_9TELE|nr:hypothetical protein EYF80_039548 [Liparis tanakae]
MDRTPLGLSLGSMVTSTALGDTSTASPRMVSSSKTRSCFSSRQSNSLHLPLTTSLVPHYLHLVLTPFSPAAPPSPR